MKPPMDRHLKHKQDIATLAAIAAEGIAKRVHPRGEGVTTLEELVKHALTLKHHPHLDFQLDTPVVVVDPNTGEYVHLDLSRVYLTQLDGIESAALGVADGAAVLVMGKPKNG